MEKFWLDVLTTLLGSGIGTAIVVGLSKWLGEIWSNRILENEKQENRKEIEKIKQDFQNQIECIKQDFQKEFSKMDKLNEKAIYISKTQYDKEFEIYQEIWSKLQACIKSMGNLYGGLGSDLSHASKRKEVFDKAFNEYSDALDKFSPFYKKEIGEKFEEIRKKCRRRGHLYQIYAIDVKENETFKSDRNLKMTKDEMDEFYKTIPNNIAALKKEISADIREYLFTLQII